MNRIKNAQLAILMIAILTSFTLNSQNIVWGGTGSIGLSKITLDAQVPDNYKYKFTLSGSAGVFVEKKVSEKSSIGLEALWVQIEGFESIENEPVVTSGGFVRGVLTENYYRHIGYLGIPLYYRYRFGHLGIKAGVQYMLRLASSIDQEMDGELDGEEYYFKGEWSTRWSNYDYGAKVGFDYDVSSRFRLRLDYYHGFKSITSYIIGTRRKSQQIGIGLNYNI